jgi:hypothetical protein
MRNPAHRFIHLNVDDPETLKRLTQHGVIWNTPYVDRAVAAIRAGAIRLSDCQNVPLEIRQALR